jgi:Ser/Thr protein kinase RdoA (MazF antagonist)
VAGRDLEAGSRDAPIRLGGSRGADVWSLDTPAGPCVVKTAAADRIAGEARILTEVAGLGIAPRLVATGEAVLITERIVAGSRTATDWTSADAHAVGALLARVHRAPVPDGPSPSERRAVWLGELRADPGPAGAETVRAAVAMLPSPGGGSPVLLHGDPWSGNVVWGPAPLLVDWEFARTGEPAEDLAYLAALDELSDPLLAAVLDGYGAGDALRRRVTAWRPFMAAWCAAWLAAAGDAVRGSRCAEHAAALVRPAAGGGAVG